MLSYALTSHKCCCLSLTSAAQLKTYMSKISISLHSFNNLNYIERKVKEKQERGFFFVVQTKQLCCRSVQYSPTYMNPDCVVQPYTV